MVELDDAVHEPVQWRCGRVLRRDHHEVGDREEQQNHHQRVQRGPGEPGRSPRAQPHCRKDEHRDQQGADSQRQRVEGAEARDGQERREHENRRYRPEHRRQLGEPCGVARQRARGRAPQERACPGCPEHEHAQQRRLSSATGDDRRQPHGQDPRGQGRGQQRGHRWEGTTVGSARDGVRQPGHRNQRNRQDHEEGRQVERGLGVLPLRRAKPRDGHGLHRGHHDRHHGGKAGARERDREHKSDEERRTHRTTAQLRPLTAPFG